MRQTSFKALAESVLFTGEQPCTHTARFGEIEQRGAALTIKGRALYDKLLAQAGEQTQELDNQQYQRQLAAVFTAFPDDATELRRQGLAFFNYQLTSAGLAARGCYSTHTLPDQEALLEQGLLTATPLTYEDFLPVSAAGIFQSNLFSDKKSAPTATADTLQAISSREPSNGQEEFEHALGCPVIDPFALYAAQEQVSYAQAVQTLVG